MSRQTNNRLLPTKAIGFTDTIAQARCVLANENNILAYQKQIAKELKVKFNPFDFEVTKNIDNNLLIINFDNGKTRRENQYTIVPINC